MCNLLNIFIRSDTMSSPGVRAHTP